MKVFLNHDEIFVGTRCSLRDLLAGSGQSVDNSSVAVNNCIIPKEEWADKMLKDSDKIIIVAAQSL